MNTLCILSFILILGWKNENVWKLGASNVTFMVFKNIL